MRRTGFSAVLILLALLALGLNGCSDFDEMKGDRSLLRAEALMQQGNAEQAEQALTELVAKYPGTRSGEVASKYLERMQKQRKLREREAFGKVIDSYQQVLDGYHAIYAEYPRSLAALDQSGYFFDSAYLEEITPDGFMVYLWLKSDGSGYRLWCVAQENTRGYAIEALSRDLVPFERVEIEQQIKARFQANDWSGKLIVLQ